MQVQGKEATPVRLNCPNSCGGFVEDEVLIYLTEDDRLTFYGRCSTCESHGYVSISLIELLIQSPNSLVS